MITTKDEGLCLKSRAQREIAMGAMVLTRLEAHRER